MSPIRDSSAAAEDLRRTAARMSRIGRKFVVLSGKGGVGKSTVAANLAIALARRGRAGRVGLLDIDLHGPSIPRMLGLEGRVVHGQPGSLEPVEHGGLLKVMSIGFLLRSETTAVIWRGPRKYGAIRQFLTDVEWGDLDCLVVDSPPGTGDEPLAVCQLLAGRGPGGEDPPEGTEAADVGAIVVTTPQGVAVANVKRCLGFCREIGMPIHGIVENMSGLTCPQCGHRIEVFRTGGGEAMARAMGVPFLGRIPLDPAIVESGDCGRPIVGGSEEAWGVGEVFDAIARKLADRERAPGGGCR